MKGLLAVLAKAKGSGDDDESAPESSSDVGGDYRQIAKDAAKDGDWDAMIDALCDYIDKE